MKRNSHRTRNQRPLDDRQLQAITGGQGIIGDQGIIGESPRDGGK